MRAVVEEYSNDLIDFPCLMKSTASGMILLANKVDKGYIYGTVLVSGESERDVGCVCTDIASSVFVPFTGKVTLVNSF